MLKDYGKVSIVMPAFNAEKYIGDAIDSVRNQTYTNWELLIVDDCSTDNTREIITSIEDKRIRYLKNSTNSGAAISRNYALREADGKWIALLDSDDVWTPNKLEKQIEFMMEHGYAFTFTDYRICLNGSWLPYVCTGPNHVNKKNFSLINDIKTMFRTVGAVRKK